MISQIDFSQFSNHRQKKILINSDTIVIDSLSVIPGTFLVLTSEFGEYELIHESAKVVWKSAYPLDSIEISYKVFPLLLENTFYSKDTSLIRKVEDNSGFNPGFAYEVSEIPEGYNSAEGIRKSGTLMCLTIDFH